MAQILPFRGTMYDAGSGLDLNAVLAPPYDIIGPALQEVLYARSPFNIVRLILGYIRDEDSEMDNRYTRAADDLADWKSRGVLKAAAQPAIYLYDQQFAIAGEKRFRRGFIALLKLEDFGAKVVHPHEVTYAEPRADRLSLLRACHANFSQIFALYSDEGREVETALSKAANATPLADFVDEDGIRHVLWNVEEKDALQEAVRLMSTKQIFIADGHHRYETALLHMREMRAGNGPEEDASYDFVPAFFVSLQNPGLVILPVHRVLPGGCHGVREPAKLLEEHLDIVRTSESLDEKALGDLTQWVGEAGASEHRFGMVTPQGLFSVGIRNEEELSGLIDTGHSESWRSLDVSVIQELGIKRCLSAEEMAREGSIEYLTSALDALREVAIGRARLAFLLRPTTVKDIERIALNGEKMPPKSSYFHPKPLSGMVIYDHATGLGG